MSNFSNGGNEGYPTGVQRGGASPYDIVVPNYPALPQYQGERFRSDPYHYEQNAQIYAYTHRGMPDVDRILYDVYSPQLFSRPVSQPLASDSYPTQDIYGSQR